MPTNRSVLHNTLFQILGKSITVLCSLGVVKLITNVGQGFYGDYVTTYEFLAFFGIIADAGLFAIAVKEMSQDKKKSEYILGNILSLRLLLILLVCTLAVIAAQFIPTYDPRIKQGIIITAASMGLTIIAGTLSSVLQSRMKIQYFSGSLAFGKMILLGLVSYLMIIGPGKCFTQSTECSIAITENELFIQLLYAGLISNIIFVSLVWFFVSREITIRLKFDWEYWKQTFKVSLPYGLALILQTLYLRLDILLISILLTSQATGIYGVCARIMESFLILGVFFGQAILPKLSKESSDTQASSKTITWAIEKVLIIALPIIWGGYLFADEIVVILSNESFLSTSKSLGSNHILQVLLPTVLFAYLNQLFTFTLVSKNRQNYLLIVNLFAVCFNGLLNWYLIPQYGLISAALTTVASEILVLLFLSYEIHKHFKPKIINLNVIFIISLNVFLFTLFSSVNAIRSNLMMAVTLGAIIYAIALYSMRKQLS